VKTGKNDLGIAALIENLQDADQLVRLHAATVLGSMGDEAEPAVPALVKLLQTGDVHDRRLAALALGEIGPAAEEAIPALFAAVDDEDEGVTEMVEWALERVDLFDDEAEAA
jgi:HEAT repeat protein